MQATPGCPKLPPGCRQAAHPQAVDGQLQAHLKQQEEHAQLAQLLNLLQVAEQAAGEGLEGASDS